MNDDNTVTIRVLARMLAVHAVATSLAHLPREVSGSSQLPTRAELIDGLAEQFEQVGRGDPG